MMLQLVLVCCVVRWAAADDTLFFVPHSQLSKNISCPDTTQCPVGNTCCPTQDSNQFGCCPYNNAMCCSDGVHCCQKGTECRPDGGGCFHPNSVSDQRPAEVKTLTVKSVLCPDHQGMCPNGQICCEGRNGQYACCKFDGGVCCPDKIHCCQAGLTCDLQASRCVKKGIGYMLTTLFNRPLTRTEPMTSPVSSSAQEMKAFCCADGLHCCPEGTVRCDIQKGVCDRLDSSSVPWVTKTPAMVKDPVKCDDAHECPEGSTCCRQSSGQWGCCAMPQAVCCSDGEHCCPSGTTCDLTKGTCDSQDGFSVSWFKKTAAIRKEVEGVICPGGTSQCPDGNTCCKMASGQYGCCPLPQAVCCSDHTHCCPTGTTCDVSSGKCNRKDGFSMTWFEKTPAISKKVDSIVCPGGTSQCPDGNTCCKLSTGQWGCCPLPQAVCCSDGTHCCPSGTTCDVSTGACTRQDGSSVSWFEKSPAISRKVDSVVCPGGTSQCPDGNTCCKMASGQYGCCPLPQAVCCSDHTHCCPTGTTCDVSSGKCNRQDGFSMTWFEKTPAISKKVDSVQCPDGQSQCPDGNTCCKMASGQWGCCPLPQAVCCSDHTHCCPTGTTCDVSSGKCNRKDGFSMTWFEKTPAISKKVDSVVCPDGQSQCPDGNTCCKMTTGQWGCCPHVQAVCCSDGIHCCPSGTTCDASTGECNRQDGFSLTWFKKTPALKKDVKDVMCADQQSECPDGSTCCKLPTGQYGCCPIPKAVCCSDGVHCCPSGTTCDISSGKCNKQDGLSVDWLEKTKAVKKGDGIQIMDSFADSMRNRPQKPSHVEMFQEETISCPGEDVECPGGSTCCKLLDDSWGCCPHAKASCCSDGVHCCPGGMTCNTEQGTCSKDGFSFTWTDKKPARAKKIPKEDLSIEGTDPVEVDLKAVGNVKCSEQSSCPDNQTCCPTSGSNFGCCPLPKAVCCSDGVHCCPHGTTCDVAQGKCLQADEPLSLVFTSASKEEMVRCEDGRSECPDGNTCCKLATGQYGCCPMPKAVCCSDGVHCCPTGMTCEVSTGRCNRQDGSSVSWFEKTPAISKKVDSVVCPGGTSQCPDGNTCCKLSTGQWGCCPLPQAVCCSDGTHCCPSGTTCDVSTGACTRQDGSSVSWFEKTWAVSKKVDSVVCPGGTSQCPDGNTCCKLSTGQWGCCPLPKAVCCSDGTHCCPSGTTCDTAGGSCKRQDGSRLMDWVKKVPANPITAVMEHPANQLIAVQEDPTNQQLPVQDAVFFCNGTKKKCNQGQTCCPGVDGQYGCCVFSNGVCCSDGTHCCPSGTRCEVESGHCMSDGQHMPSSSSIHLQEIHQDELRDVQMVKCPDGTSECPDGNTCCKLPTGQYGCCPMPKAVCCSDGVHCCPSGTTCDVSQGKCNRQDGTSLFWFKKTTAISKKVEMVKCDETHDCPDGNTCCKLSTGQWGCCPLPQAVCCSDGTHCCPGGTTCDVSTGACNTQDGSSVSWFEKTAALKKVDSIVCPDQQSQCPDGNTCCKLSTGQYGCCPMPEAVCCSDGVHCCPSGTTCDLAQSTCNKQDGTVVAWLKKTVSEAIQQKDVKDMKCDDGSTCPDGSTCCELKSGSYGCCPLPSAECCSDGVHCCPENYKCDAGKCTQGFLSIPFS